MENNVTRNQKKEVKRPGDIPSPVQIKEYLDRYVVGQDEAKKTLAVAAYNHYKRIAHRGNGNPGSDIIGKSNVLLLGETGSGKTLLVKTLAKLLSVPYHVQDCTKITASGYVGSDVEDCIVGLLRNSGYDREASERGIVMLDEVDKIKSASAGRSVTRDVSGECVQQSLLKIMEGDIVGCPPQGGRKNPEQPLFYVNTSDILFIASGAFVGLDDIVARRLGAGKNRIGFSGPGNSDGTGAKGKGELLSLVQPCDLREFGLIPEFIGRLPIITSVSPLGKDELLRILTEPCDSLVNQYTGLLAMDGVKLEFTPESLNAVADRAIELGTGARGPRNILEEVMRDVMFNAPSMRKPRGREKCVVITEDMVRSYSPGMRVA